MMTSSPIHIADEPRKDESNDQDQQQAIYPKEYEGHFDRLLISRQEILKRTRELAQLIHQDYYPQRPVIICVLKGANPFYQHLLEALQELQFGYTMEFLRVSSYSGTQSTGVVSIETTKTAGGRLNPAQLQGRHVILVEDIVDTGTTLSKVVPHLRQECGSQPPKSIEVCTLLDKRLPKKNFQAKYVGFTIPNAFIVGYGLDYNEIYRDVRDIWVLSQVGIDADPNTSFKV